MKEKKQSIKSLSDLKRERRRLKTEIAERELLMKADFESFKEAIKPISLVSKWVSKLVISEDKTVLNKWVDTAVTFALRNVVLSRAGWVTKLVVPMVARNLANHKLEENKADIVETLRSWLHKWQDKRAAKAKSNGHFDRSTADINL